MFSSVISIGDAASSGIVLLKKLPKERTIDTEFSDLEAYLLIGSSFNDANGRFVEFRMRCGSRAYRNVRGWFLFRTNLKEIPELGIFADGCYTSFGENLLSQQIDMSAGYLN
jgi:hypothetical protein